MTFLKKAWHWLMIGCMVSMIAMAGHIALIANAANTGFLNIASSYLGHIWSGLSQSLLPAGKAFLTAGQNLLATFGLVDPVSAVGAVAPPPGTHAAMGHAVASPPLTPAAAPVPPPVPAGLGETMNHAAGHLHAAAETPLVSNTLNIETAAASHTHLGQQFSAAGQAWFEGLAPDVQEQFSASAARQGKTIMELASEMCGLSFAR